MSGNSLWRLFLGCALLACGQVAKAEGVSTDSAGGWSGRVDGTRGLAVIEREGRTLLTYAFATHQYKPYVRELYTLDGRNVLRDAPPDHLHHHGLMLALRVNGVNFWEEREPAGRQVPEGPPRFELRGARGASRKGQAILTQWIRWQSADSMAELLRERRVLRLGLSPDGEGVVLDWISEFETRRGTGRIVLHGPDYHGLGLRLPAEFDHVAEFENGFGLPFSEAQTYDVRPAAWTAVSGPLGVGRAQLMLAAHPGNPGGHAFFSMRNAFAYLAATPESSRYPVEIREGGSFSLRYRLWVRGAPSARESPEDAMQAWLSNP